GSNPSSPNETVTGTLAVAGATGYTAQSVSGTHGLFQLNSDGTYTYTLTSPVTEAPAADNSTDTVSGVEHFGYTAHDANGNTVTGSITIDVTDDVPKANDDTWATTITGPNTQLTGLLGNDVFGADGVNLSTGVSLVSTTTAHGGTVSYNNGTFTYSPAAHYNGADTFQYTITDGDGDTSTATVTLNVQTNTIPTAGTDSFTLNEDGLPGGFPGGPGDIASTATSHSGTLPADFSTDGKAATNAFN